MEETRYEEANAESSSMSEANSSDNELNRLANKLMCQFENNPNEI